MAVSKNTVMLKPDSSKILIAMAERQMDPADLAQEAGQKHCLYNAQGFLYET